MWYFEPMENFVYPAYYFLDAHLCGSSIVESRNRFSASGKDHQFYEISSPDGIHFWYSNLPLRESLRFTIENDTPYYHFQFNLICENSIQVNGGSTAPAATFSSNEYNMLYVPQTSTMNIEVAPNQQLEFFGCSFLASFFEQHMPLDHPIYQDKTLNISSADAQLVRNKHIQLTPKVKNILYEILHCPLEQRYKGMFLKAKVIELMAIHLEQSEQALLVPEKPAFHIKEEYVEKMYAAKAIIHEQVRQTPGLIELAHLVGTNENYLKKYFKQLFGSSVFNYILKVKMEKAQELIANEKKTIIEAASAVGYKHPHHFSTAFKRFFGYSPNKLKVLFYGWFADLHVAFFVESVAVAGI